MLASKQVSRRHVAITASNNGTFEIAVVSFVYVGIIWSPSTMSFSGGN